jgi:S-formylglutathione hydrolase FrmB
MSSGQRAAIRAAAAILCFAAVVALVLAVAPEACAAGRAECRTVPSKILGHPVAYCAILPPSYDADQTRRFPVLYMLHGLGQNEQVLVNSSAMNLVDDMWEQKQIGEFVIVTPAARRSFYINSSDGKVRYEDFFLREFIPAIESRYRIRAQRGARGISGVSMGGYGALHLAFVHPELFDAVSAHSAALIQIPVHAKVSHENEEAIIQIVGTAFGSPFDWAYWERESPFTQAREKQQLAGLKIYFDCGTEDDLGFNVGAQAFHDLLVSRGIPHEFHLYPGGHDASYFAEHLPASLKFQAEAFGLGAAMK